MREKTPYRRCGRFLLAKPATRSPLRVPAAHSLATPSAGGALSGSPLVALRSANRISFAAPVGVRA